MLFDIIIKNKQKKVHLHKWNAVYASRPYTAVLYESMLKVGLQYGPAFRLLSQVWIPEAVADAQAEGAEGGVEA